MRPSTATLSPRCVMIDSDCAPPASASRIGAGLGEQRVQPACRHDRGEVLVAAPFEEVAVGVKQRIVPVDQNADRNAVEQRVLDESFRGGRGGRGGCGGLRCFSRQPFDATLGGGRRLLRSVQPRGQFLGQFAECPAFHRAQSRRRFGLGRRRGAKRHHIGGSRRDAERGPIRCRGSFGRGGGLGFLRRGGSRRRFRRRHKTHRTFAARARQLVDAVDVAADAEAAIAAEAAVAVEHRQARHFDRQPLAGIVHRPGHDNTAPGFAARHRARHRIGRIELQFGGDLAPLPAECGRGARSHQLDEFVRADAETTVRIHVPDKTQRVAPLGGRLMRARRRQPAVRQ